MKTPPPMPHNNGMPFFLFYERGDTVQDPRSALMVRSMDLYEAKRQVPGTHRDEWVQYDCRGTPIYCSHAPRRVWDFNMSEPRVVLG